MLVGYPMLVGIPRSRVPHAGGYTMLAGILLARHWVLYAAGIICWQVSYAAKHHVQTECLMSEGYCTQAGRLYAGAAPYAKKHLMLENYRILGDCMLKKHQLLKERRMLALYAILSACGYYFLTKNCYAGDTFSIGCYQAPTNIICWLDIFFREWGLYACLTT